MRQTYASIVASGDHVPQLVLTSRSGAQVVADWLVSLPPRPPRAVENNVLIGRGDLCEKTVKSVLTPIQGSPEELIMLHRPED